MTKVGITGQAVDSGSETSDKSDGQTRRHFLGAGAALGATVLTGCSQDTNNTPTPNLPKYDTSRPALYFYSDARSQMFNTDRLITYDDLNPGTVLYDHPDSEAFPTEFTSDELTLTFEGVVTRPVTLAINILTPPSRTPPRTLA